MSPELLRNLYHVFKALHVIGFVSWFAGLFYLVRLFIYHSEAFTRPENEQSVLLPQFKLMEHKLYFIITNPAMMITWFAGIAMLLIGDLGLELGLLHAGWMHLKLLLLLGLTLYHLYNKRIMLKLWDGISTYNSSQLRMYNEVATLFLVAISLIAVFGKNGNPAYAIFALGGLVLFGLFIALGMRAYRKYRIRNGEL